MHAPGCDCEPCLEWRDELDRREQSILDRLAALEGAREGYVPCQHINTVINIVNKRKQRYCAKCGLCFGVVVEPPRAESTGKALDTLADYDQTPEEAERELIADGVDVPAFLGRVEKAIEEQKPAPAAESEWTTLDAKYEADTVTVFYGGSHIELPRKVPPQSLCVFVDNDATVERVAHAMFADPARWDAAPAEQQQACRLEARRILESLKAQAVTK